MAHWQLKKSGNTTHFSLVGGLRGWGTDSPDGKYHFVSDGGDAAGLQNFIVEGSGRGSGVTFRATGAGGVDISVYSGGTDHPGELVFLQPDTGVDLERMNFAGCYKDVYVLPADADGLPQAPAPPPPGYVRLYMRDDGNGRVEQCVMFPSGAEFRTHFEGYLEADFTASVTTGAAPLSVTFTNTSRNESATPTYHWERNPGDGWSDFAGTPTAENPTEVFADAGTYAVRLTNTRADGDSVKTVYGMIVVTEPPPPGPGGVAGLALAGDVSELVKPDGAMVSKVPAAHGTAVTFTSEGTRRPTFRVGRTPSGLPSLEFDGVNDRFDFTPTGPFADWHVFFVMKITRLTTVNQAYLGGPNGQARAAIISTASVNDNVVNDAGDSGPVNYPSDPKDSDWHVYEFKCDAGVVTRKVDGVVIGTTPTVGGVQEYTFSTLGNIEYGNTPMKAEWAGWFLYEDALADGDADDVRDALVLKYLTP